MSNCPYCGAEQKPNVVYVACTRFNCETNMLRNGQLEQTDTCRIRELEQRNDKLERIRMVVKRWMRILVSNAGSDEEMKAIHEIADAVIAARQGARR